MATGRNRKTIDLPVVELNSIEADLLALAVGTYRAIWLSTECSDCDERSSCSALNLLQKKIAELNKKGFIVLELSDVDILDEAISELVIPIVSSNFSRYVDSTATQHEFPVLETAIGISTKKANKRETYTLMSVSDEINSHREFLLFR